MLEPAVDETAPMNVEDDADERLRQAIELLFFAYRDFTGEADAILAAYGFGRAHHRAIYFVGCNPGIAVNELLTILRITKQSLARVLSQLVAQGYIRQNPDPADGRRRLLSLTQTGRQLESQLTACQSRRIRHAFAAAGDAAAAGFGKVLEGLIDDLETARRSGGGEFDG